MGKGGCPAALPFHNLRMDRFEWCSNGEQSGARLRRSTSDLGIRLASSIICLPDQQAARIPLVCRDRHESAPEPRDSGGCDAGNPGGSFPRKDAERRGFFRKARTLRPSRQHAGIAWRGTGRGAVGCRGGYPPPGRIEISPCGGCACVDFLPSVRPFGRGDLAIKFSRRRGAGTSGARIRASCRLVATWRAPSWAQGIPA